MIFRKQRSPAHAPWTATAFRAPVIGRLARHFNRREFPGQAPLWTSRRRGAASEDSPDPAAKPAPGGLHGWGTGPLTRQARLGKRTAGRPSVGGFAGQEEVARVVVVNDLRLEADGAQEAQPLRAGE